MYVVTGATGQLGSRIVRRLLERVPADQVGVSVQDVRAAASLAARGVRVRAGDFTEPATLAHAFEGASRVLVVSAAIRGAAAADAGRAAVTAARDAGADRILYTSHQAASYDSLFLPQLTHAGTETRLAELGVPYTALRNGFYAATLGHYVGDAVANGVLALPEDGPFSWTAHDDLAEVAVAALAGDATLDGITAPLTAPESLDFEAVAGLVSEITGRTVTRVVVPDEQWVGDAVAAGTPAGVARFTLGMFRAARRGEFAVTDPTLERVIGRPATSVREVLQGLVGQRA
ncbi:MULTISPECIES: NmrA family NAD(P)-binding protein [unclassified Nocardioides]|uniref:NmrA family NAD(P)-binding protein n=1 Tax=unclassified Nocardioides TaxID=2615069 RepID=UPI00301566F0